MEKNNHTSELEQQLQERKNDLQKPITDNGKGITKSEANMLIKSGIIPSGTPLEQIYVFAKVCEERGLSPFSRQIHLVKRNTKEGPVYNIQTGIDGLRSIAERTGQLAGISDYEYDQEDSEHPNRATCTVKKLLPNGEISEFSATARWREFAPSGNMAFMWKKMPYHMLGKCSESLALRKAFPECQDIYSEAETFHTDEEHGYIKLNEGQMKKINASIEKGEIEEVQKVLEHYNIDPKQVEIIQNKINSK